jgi:ribosomal protein S18 acetylase RimI-like enzyme
MGRSKITGQVPPKADKTAIGVKLPTTMAGKITTRPFGIADYDAAVELWQRVEGVEVAEGDSAEDIAQFLSRNPDLSRVAEDDDGKMVGAVLCGHDCHRGYIYHLAVDPAYQQRGLARRLIDECLHGLRQAQLRRALILVAADNPAGQAFWRRCGWEDVPEVKVLGIDL